MSAGKQLIMGQRCKQAVRERGKDLGPGLSKKPQTTCHHDGMAGLALSAALCGFRGLAVTSLWTCLGGLCTHQEGEVAMPVSGCQRSAVQLLHLNLALPNLVVFPFQVSLLAWEVLWFVFALEAELDAAAFDGLH